MPIEIKRVSTNLDRSETYKLEDTGDKVYLTLGKKGFVVRVETEPGLGRDIGVVELNPQDLTAMRNDGVKMINAPFYTRPGQELVIKRQGSAKHYEIRHLPKDKKTT